MQAQTTQLFRATIMHTPSNPFTDSSKDAFQVFEDGGLLVQNGRIVAVDNFLKLNQRDIDAQQVDLRPGFLLPGFVDTHVHYPQVYSLGTMGLTLLDWLRQRILPDELRFSDRGFAWTAAKDFLTALISHGTTTALVFGVHDFEAQNSLFVAALELDYRLLSGMITADRNLLEPMHKTPAQATIETLKLIERWHNKGKLRYALTPRLAISTSSEMFKALQELLEARTDLYVQTHLNETLEEVAIVEQLFPHCRDYLSVYESYGLLRPRAVFAHNIHTNSSQLQRLAQGCAAVAHCPSSNAFLGSGLFPLRAHIDHGVKVAIGCDVGAGVSLSLPREGLYAYQMQMLQSDGYRLSPPQLLYLITRAGAQALALEDQIGDFRAGKCADMVLLQPPPESLLEQQLNQNLSPIDKLGVLFTMAEQNSIAEVYMGGKRVYALK